MPAYIDFTLVSNSGDHHAYFFTTHVIPHPVGVLYSTSDLARSSRETLLSMRFVLSTGCYIDVYKDTLISRMWRGGEYWNREWDEIIEGRGIMNLWFTCLHAVTPRYDMVEALHFDWKEDGPLTDTLGNSGNLFVARGNGPNFIIQNCPGQPDHGYDTGDKTFQMNRLNRMIKLRYPSAGPL